MEVEKGISNPDSPPEGSPAPHTRIWRLGKVERPALGPTAI